MTTPDTAAYDLLPFQVWTSGPDGGLDYVNGCVTDYLLGERAAVLEQSGEGVNITYREGRITFANQAAAVLHGYALLDVPTEQYSDAYKLFTEAGEPYPPHELPLARAILNDETVRDARWNIDRADGSVINAIGSAQPVRDGQGLKIGAVLTVRQAGTAA